MRTLRDREKWDRRYSAPGYRYGDAPAATLETWRAVLKAKAKQGRAADVACGEAQNGVFLATLGYRVDAIDISSVGLKKAKQLAARRGVAKRLTAIRADLEKYDLQPNRYDVIVNFRFLLRRLAPQMVAALKPGGVLIFESFTVDDPVLCQKSIDTDRGRRRGVGTVREGFVMGRNWDGPKLFKKHGNGVMGTDQSYSRNTGRRSRDLRFFGPSPPSPLPPRTS